MKTDSAPARHWRLLLLSLCSLLIAPLSGQQNPDIEEVIDPSQWLVSEQSRFERLSNSELLQRGYFTASQHRPSEGHILMVETPAHSRSYLTLRQARRWNYAMSDFYVWHSSQAAAQPVEAPVEIFIIIEDVDGLRFELPFGMSQVSWQLFQYPLPYFVAQVSPYRPNEGLAWIGFAIVNRQDHAVRSFMADAGGNLIPFAELDYRPFFAGGSHER